MNDDTITIDLSGIEPLKVSWGDNNMSTGIIAQDVDSAYTTIVSGPISGPSQSTITIGSVSAAGSYTISTPWEEIEERLIKLEKIIAEEEEVRRTHPAVKMAYDEYRLLYILAKKNPGDLLTDE
jgi:hypothetical protein